MLGFITVELYIYNPAVETLFIIKFSAVNEK